MRTLLQSTMLLLAAATLPALAEAPPPQLQPLPAPPPMPATQAAVKQSASSPVSTNKIRPADKVKHYRVRNEVYMLKVTPQHGVSYFLVDPAGQGKSSRTTGNSDPALAVPSWVIRSW